MDCYFIPPITLLIIPIIPLGLHAILVHKGKQLPIGFYQNLYSLYTLLILVRIRIFAI